MTDRDILRTHSLRKYDDLIWKEHLRGIGGWMLAVTGLALAVWLLVIVSGCGGGMGPQRLAPVVPPVVSSPDPPPSTPPPPTPPITLPSHYSLTLLQPVAGGTSAQAEAISEGGDVAGWSVVDDVGVATVWARDAGGEYHAASLGPGFALAIADEQPAVGYVVDGAGLPQAWRWPGGAIGTLDGYDSSEALGIDGDGTVVGVAFNMAAGGQAAFRWTPAGGMVAIPGMQTALAIRHSHVAGIGDDFNARVDDAALPVEGAATAISDAGAAGYSFGTVEGFSWQDGSLILLGTNGTSLSLASGINAGGIIVGQEGNGMVGSVRLAPRRPQAKVAGRDVFVGATRAMAWTPSDGMVDLNGRVDDGSGEWGLVFASGISDSGSVVGAAVSNVTMQTVGFLLVPE